MSELWSKVAESHTVDEEVIAATEQTVATGGRPWHEIGRQSLQACRDQLETMMKDNDVIPCHGTPIEMTIPASGSQPEIPIYVHQPCQPAEVPTIVLYFHGGGLVLGSAKGYRRSIQNLAEEMGAIIVNVEYRLLPNAEDPLCCFNDVVAAAKWLMANKEAVGGVAESKVGVLGDSAGGQLACCVTREVQGFAFQVLVYPVADMDCTLPSFVEFADIPNFNTKDMIWMFEEALSAVPNASTNPRVNPSANKDLSASPPTLILSAGLDPLLDWAVAYEHKLRGARVPVKRVTYPSLAHGFFTVPAAFPKARAKAITDVVAFMKSLQ